MKYPAYRVFFRRRSLTNINLSEMKKHILVVTKNTGFLEMLDKNLSGSFSVRLAENGSEAYEMLEEGFFPELIITEFNMSLQNGKRLVLKIKENNRLIPIPILIISQNERTFPKLDLIRTGITGHIVKPFMFTDLETKVKSLLEVTN
jgi:two-component system, chemotaxis family, chemotaxis protein CheY